MKVTRLLVSAVFALLTAPCLASPGSARADPQAVAEKLRSIDAYVVLAPTNARNITLATRLDGTIKLVRIPDPAQFRFIVALPEGTSSGTTPRLPPYSAEVGDQIAAALAAPLGLDPGSTAGLARFLSSNAADRSFWLHTMDRLLKQRYDDSSILLMPTSSLAAAQPLVDSGLLAVLATVNISSIVEPQAAEIEAAARARVAARAASEEMAARLETAGDRWFGIVFRPDEADAASPRGAAPAAPRTCAVRATSRDAAIASTGYRYLDSFAAQAAVRKDTRYTALLPTLDDLFEQVQRHGCSAAVVSASEAAQLVAGLRRLNIDFLLLQGHAPKELAVSYEASQKDAPLQATMIADRLKTSAEQAQKIMAAGFTTEAAVAAAIERMSSSGYSTSDDSETVLRFAEDEAAAVSGKTTALEIKRRREAMTAAEQKRQVEAAHQAQAALDAKAVAAEEREKVDLWMKIIAVVVAVIALIYMGVGWAASCPSCKKWFARQELSVNLIGQSSGYEFRTQTDTHRDKEGKVVGTSDRKVQVHVTRSTYEHHNRCKHCQHKWLTQSQTASA